MTASLAEASIRCSRGGDGSAGEVLVHRLAGAGELAVVVDDQDATRHEPWVEVLELVLGRLVEVGVEAEQRQLARGLGGQRVLDPPADEAEPIGRVPGRLERRPDALLREHVGVEVLGPRPALASLPELARGAVALAGLGHPLEGVVEPELAVGDAELLERRDHRHDRAAAPDAALGEGPGDPRADDAADRPDEGEQARDPCQRVREGELDDAAIGGVDRGELLLGQLRERALDGLRAPHRAGLALAEQDEAVDAALADHALDDHPGAARRGGELTEVDGGAEPGGVVLALRRAPERRP